MTHLGLDIVGSFHDRSRVTRRVCTDSTRNWTRDGRGRKAGQQTAPPMRSGLSLARRGQSCLPHVQAGQSDRDPRRQDRPETPPRCSGQAHAVTHLGLEKRLLRKRSFWGVFPLFFFKQLSGDRVHTSTIHPLEVYGSELLVYSPSAESMFDHFQAFSPQPVTAPLLPKGPPGCVLSPCASPLPCHRTDCKHHTVCGWTSALTLSLNVAVPPAPRGLITRVSFFEL